MYTSTLIPDKSVLLEALSELDVVSSRNWREKEPNDLAATATGTKLVTAKTMVNKTEKRLLFLPKIFLIIAGFIGGNPP